MKYIKNLLLALFAIIIIVACGEKITGEKIEPDMDRSGIPLIITVFVYDTKREMQQAHADKNNREVILGEVAWAEWSNAKVNPWCNIHVVKMKWVNQEGPMSDWGHELLHCVSGSFHKKVE